MDRGQLPSDEYLKTDPLYDLCLAQSGSTKKCGAVMRVKYRQLQTNIANKVAEKEQQEKCVREAKEHNGDMFACYDPFAGEENHRSRSSHADWCDRAASALSLEKDVRRHSAKDEICDTVRCQGRT